MQALSPRQFSRYARHLCLEGVGVEGQQRLLAAKVLVVGLGGLGSPLAQYLTAAGVGSLGLADGDRIAESNLQRQVLYLDKEVGDLKAERAAARLKALNPDPRLAIHPSLNAANAAALLADYQIVADCSDNFACRYLLNQQAARAQKPLVSASVSRFEGQLGVFVPWRGESHPCYRCIFPTAPAEAANCNQEGILGPSVGVMGSLQALEVLKLILELPVIDDGLLLFDGLKSAFKRLTATRSRRCPLCRELGY